MENPRLLAQFESEYHREIAVKGAQFAFMTAGSKFAKDTRDGLLLFADTSLDYFAALLTSKMDKGKSVKALSVTNTLKEREGRGAVGILFLFA